MNLNDIYSAIEAHLLATYTCGIKFSGRTIRSLRSGSEACNLDCVLMPVEPFESSFCKTTKQFILQLRYISEIGGGGIPKSHEKNASDIISRYGIGYKVGDLSVYRPTSITQWFVQDTTRECVISVYFQIDEVI